MFCKSDVFSQICCTKACMEQKRAFQQYSSNILDYIYSKSVILEGELSSAEMQAIIGNNYGKLLSAFNNFRNILKKQTCQQQNVSAKPKRLVTLTDMFSRVSSSKLKSIVFFVILLK